MRANGLRIPSKGFTIIELVMFVVFLAFMLSQVAAYYQKSQVEKYLDEKLPTVEWAYKSRARSAYTAMELSKDAYMSRAPGAYLRVISHWNQFASADADSKRDPDWLLALKKDEQKKVQGLLKEAHTTQEELSALSAKLEKISPQLSDAESAKLVELSQPTALMGLALVNEETAHSIFDKLKSLDLSERGLYENGIKDHPDYKDR